MRGQIQSQPNGKDAGGGGENSFQTPFYEATNCTRDQLAALQLCMRVAADRELVRVVRPGKRRLVGRAVRLAGTAFQEFESDDI
jgi:hypothetical protein